MLQRSSARDQARWGSSLARERVVNKFPGFFPVSMCGVSDPFRFETSGTVRMSLAKSL